MRIIPTTLLAGIGSLALAGAVAAHTLAVRLPDGTTERISYAGKVAPQIAFVPAAALPNSYQSLFAPAIAPNSPFALMQQISAGMDRQAATMLRQAQALAAQPSAGLGPITVDMSRLPQGAQGYSFVATLTPGGACMQSMEIIATGPGRAPQVVSHRSGNCGTLSGAPATVAAPDEAPAAGPAQHHARIYQASTAGNPAYRGMLHAASW
ncbi:MAG TPA: hypothetical protein VNF99_21770 [Stellaceae bacterium]|nr:hypothetical protein [Stellaceae bacterium]